MRVISGTAKGHSLKCLKGDQTRPTTDKVRQSIFNIIMHDVEGRAALDLFSGTGALGIEALSRGAAECVFVESGKQAAQIIKANLEHTKLIDLAQIKICDVYSFLNTAGNIFELIFMDPPYGKEHIPKVLNIIYDRGILHKAGLIIAESDQDDYIPEAVGNIQRFRQQKYGRIMISFFRMIDKNEDSNLPG